MQLGKFYKHRNMIDVCIEVVTIEGDKMEIYWWQTKYRQRLDFEVDEVPYPKNINEWYEVKL